MIIDFHTHTFPDKIAEKTIQFLADTCKTHPYANGTCKELLNSMTEAGIDKSIVLPVVTKPSQFHSINEFASHYQNGRLLSFGGIHPMTEHYKEELHQIKDMGFLGIKLHPDYQNLYFNDIRYKRIIALAEELGLIVSVHAGLDPKCPADIHCTPKMAAEVLREVQPTKLVLAHFGGNEMWDDVEHYLVGENVYLDTAVVLDTMEHAQFLRMVKNHGADKILFATDSPWREQKNFVNRVRNMELTEEEKTAIFSGNACRLLGIS